MSYEMIELTDELVAQTAAKFGISEAEVRKQYAETVALGPQAALTQMNQYVTDLEREIEEITADTSARWLHNGHDDRERNIAEFYQEGWDALSAEEITDASVGDLFLKLSVSLYKLAEANEKIAELSDSNHRRGGA